MLLMHMHHALLLLASMSTRHKPGFCYIIRKGDTGKIKIGYSKDLEERRSSLQTPCDERLEVIAFLWSGDAYGMEQMLLNKYDDANLNKGKPKKKQGGKELFHDYILADVVQSHGLHTCGHSRLQLTEDPFKVDIKSLWLPSIEFHMSILDTDDITSAEYEELLTMLHKYRGDDCEDEFGVEDLRKLYRYHLRVYLNYKLSITAQWLARHSSETRIGDKLLLGWNLSASVLKELEPRYAHALRKVMYMATDQLGFKPRTPTESRIIPRAKMMDYWEREASHINIRKLCAELGLELLPEWKMRCIPPDAFINAIDAMLRVGLNLEFQRLKGGALRVAKRC